MDRRCSVEKRTSAPAGVSAQQLNWGSTSLAQRDQRHPDLLLAEPESQVARTSKKRIFEERKEHASAGDHHAHSAEQDDDAFTELDSDDSGATIFGL